MFYHVECRAIRHEEKYRAHLWHMLYLQDNKWRPCFFSGEQCRKQPVSIYVGQCFRCLLFNDGELHPAHHKSLCSGLKAHQNKKKKKERKIKYTQDTKSSTPRNFCSFTVQTACSQSDTFFCSFGSFLQNIGFVMKHWLCGEFADTHFLTLFEGVYIHTGWKVQDSKPFPPQL